MQRRLTVIARPSQPRAPRRRPTEHWLGRGWLCAVAPWGFGAVLVGLLLGVVFDSAGQAPTVPIYQQGRKQTDADVELCAAAKGLYADSKAVHLAAATNQLKRESCQLILPPPNSKKLTPREICILARRSHLRVGWSYLCNKCEQWHINLAGGYALTSDGAVATCYHVVQPRKEIRDGCLVAADEEGTVFPVTEVLAANKYSDVCILRVSGTLFAPLALSTNVYPGDTAYCYSDPLDHRGFFSQNIVNRFYQFPGRRRVTAPSSANYAPTRIDVGTDWAPGSSGSAVLDDCGNAIGHVSTIATMSEEKDSADQDTPTPGPTMIIFHEAVSARDVLRLVSPKGE